jgi:hypothetical protein
MTAKSLKRFSFVFALAAAALIICSPWLQAQAQAPPAGPTTDQVFQGQAPVTDDEVAKYAEYMKTAATNPAGATPPVADPTRMAYLAAKIGAAVTKIQTPNITDEQLLQMVGGAQSLVPTAEEIEIVKAHINDIMGAAMGAAPAQ